MGFRPVGPEQPGREALVEEDPMGRRRLAAWSIFPASPVSREVHC